MNMKMLAVAGALALAPLSAFAGTLTLGNSGGTFDISSETWTLETEDFAAGYGTEGSLTQGPKTFTYIFENTLDVAMNVSIDATVTQPFGEPRFEGLTFKLGDMEPYAVAPNYGLQQVSAFTLESVLAAGATTELTIYFDKAVKMKSSPLPTIEFTASAAAVPVPAGAVLLVTALGGLAVARKRRA